MTIRRHPLIVPEGAYVLPWRIGENVRYHLCHGTVTGSMSIKPTWPTDGTCPPECPNRKDPTP